MDVITKTRNISPDQLLLDSHLSLMMVELLQLQDRATISIVVSVVVLSVAIDGGKMVQCFKVKQ